MAAEDVITTEEVLEVLAVEVLLQEEKETLLQEEKAQVDLEATEEALQEKVDLEAKEEVPQEEKADHPTEHLDVLKALETALDQEDQEETNISLLIFL